MDLPSPKRPVLFSGMSPPSCNVPPTRNSSYSFWAPFELQSPKQALVESSRNHKGLTRNTSKKVLKEGAQLRAHLDRFLLLFSQHPLLSFL